MEQIMNILVERCNNDVKYENIEEIIFQYFIEEQVVEQKPQQNLEEIHNFIGLCQSLSKNKEILLVENIKSIAAQVTQETGVVLTYMDEIISIVQSENQIQVKDIFSHFGIVDQKKNLTIETNYNLSPQSVLSSMRGQLSTTQNFNIIFSPEHLLNGLFNMTYQRIDQMKKQIGKNKQLDQILKDITRIVKKIENETEILKDEGQKNNYDSEEERMHENHVLDLELEVRRYQEQVSQMIDDNETILRQVQDSEAEIEQLVQKQQISEKLLDVEQNKMNFMEAELRKKDADLRSERQAIQVLNFEKVHLHENNKSLLDIISGLEDQQNKSQIQSSQAHSSEVARQEKKDDGAIHLLQQQYRLSESENKNYIMELEYFKNQLQSSQNLNLSLEDQLQNSKREHFRYQKLYENASGEIVTQRQSIARMSLVGALQKKQQGGISARWSIALSGANSMFKQLSLVTQNDHIQEESDENSESDDSSHPNTRKQSLLQVQVEEIITLKDYMKMVESPQVKKILLEEKEKYELQFQRILSCELILGIKVGNDVVYKNQKFLLLTDYQMFIFDDMEDYQIFDQRFIASIDKIVLNQGNSKLCSFFIHEDIIHSSCVHRSDITVFLTDAFIMRKLTLFKQDHVKDVKKRQSTIAIDLKSSMKQEIQPNLFRMEYAEVYEKNLWVRYFLVLSNVGILVFTHPCEFIPSMFIVLNNVISIKNPKVKDEDVKYGIKLSGEQNQEHIFKFESVYEQSEWFEKIKLIQKQFVV